MFAVAGVVLFRSVLVWESHVPVRPWGDASGVYRVESVEFTVAGTAMMPPGETSDAENEGCGDSVYDVTSVVLRRVECVGDCCCVFIRCICDAEHWDCFISGFCCSVSAFDETGCLEFL